MNCLECGEMSKRQVIGFVWRSIHSKISERAVGIGQSTPRHDGERRPCLRVARDAGTSQAGTKAAAREGLEAFARCSRGGGVTRPLRATTGWLYPQRGGLARLTKAGSAAKWLFRARPMVLTGQYNGAYGEPPTRRPCVGFVQGVPLGVL